MEQVEFAREIGVEAETYRTYERGRSQPKFAVLERICERTGVSLDWLIRGKAMKLPATASNGR
jgi:transcriptional regulator with XRE-family HTH domain